MVTMVKILALVLSLSLGVAVLSHAQSTGGETPADFPQPIYVPEKSLNVYDKSTISSGFGSYRKTGSTLGSYQKRKSNAELNKPTKKEKKEKKKANNNSFNAFNTAEGPAPYVPPTAKNEVGKRGSFYVWVDENGVRHVTNYLSSVPLKEQIEQNLLEKAP